MPKVERRKLDSKKRKCVLLGYGTDQKGYSLCDLQRMKVIHSRDVVFDETSMPGIQKERETSANRLNLEVEEEPAEELLTPESVPEETPVHENPGGEESTTSHLLPPSESDLRRSTRNRQKPDRYGYKVLSTSTEQQDPSSVADVKSSPDKVKWEKAMEKEMESLRANKVWELVELPPNQKVVGSKWIFKRKVDADGAVVRYKARLVAQGCTQKFGLNYKETLVSLFASNPSGPL